MNSRLEIKETAKITAHAEGRNIATSGINPRKRVKNIRMNKKIIVIKPEPSASNQLVFGTNIVLGDESGSFQTKLKSGHDWVWAKLYGNNPA